MKGYCGTPLVHFLLRSCLGFLAVFLVYRLGSKEESKMCITGTTLLLMGTSLLFLGIFSRLYSAKFYQLFGKRVVITIDYSIFF